MIPDLIRIWGKLGCPKKTLWSKEQEIQPTMAQVPGFAPRPPEKNHMYNLPSEVGRGC